MESSLLFHFLWLTLFKSNYTLDFSVPIKCFCFSALYKIEIFIFFCVFLYSGNHVMHSIRQMNHMTVIAFFCISFYQPLTQISFSIHFNQLLWKDSTTIKYTGIHQKGKHFFPHQQEVSLCVVRVESEGGGRGDCQHLCTLFNCILVRIITSNQLLSYHMSVECFQLGEQKFFSRSLSFQFYLACIY